MTAGFYGILPPAAPSREVLINNNVVRDQLLLNFIASPMGKGRGGGGGGEKKGPLSPSLLVVTQEETT